MAPEIIEHKTYGNKVDVWSLGVLLYEMLNGYAPYTGNPDLNSLQSNITFEDYIKDDAKDLIKSILVTDVDKRPELWEVFSHPWIQRMNKQIIDLKIAQLYCKKIIYRKEESKKTEDEKMRKPKKIHNRMEIMNGDEQIKPIPPQAVQSIKEVRNPNAIRKPLEGNIKLIENKMPIENTIKVQMERKNIPINRQRGIPKRDIVANQPDIPNSSSNPKPNPKTNSVADEIPREVLYMYPGYELNMEEDNNAISYPSGSESFLI